jgi:endonuclease/exonuclease/phosphatase (EEP) superfamily protein YafD
MKSILLFIIIIIFFSSCYTPALSPLVIKGLENVQGIKKPLPDIKGPTIRLLSWNIHKEGNEKNWINDILNTDCTRNPDIILFQEAKLNAGLKYVLKVKNLDWRFVANAIKNKEYTGVLTASQSVSLNDIPLISDEKEPMAETPKAILITSYLVNTNGINTPLLVANVHGLNFVAHKDFYQQIEKLYQALLPHVKEMAIIVAGDFNAWSSKRVSILNEYFSKLDLKEVTTLQNVTTSSWFVRLFTLEGKLPLDRVYYSHKKLVLNECESKVLDCVHSSDHKPLYMEFLIR